MNFNNYGSFNIGNSKKMENGKDETNQQKKESIKYNSFWTITINVIYTYSW